VQDRRGTKANRKKGGSENRKSHPVKGESERNNAPTEKGAGSQKNNLRKAKFGNSEKVFRETEKRDVKHKGETRSES